MTRAGITTDLDNRPMCCGRLMIKNGHQRSGSQKFLCPICSKRLTAGGKRRGGTPLNPLHGAMTSTERSRRFRARQRAKANS